MIKDAQFKHDVEKYLATIPDKLGIIETKYGKLTVVLHRPEKRQKIFSIFTRFEEPKKAAGNVAGVNPFSGKWNFHCRSPERCLEIFKYCLKQIVIQKTKGE